MSLDRPKRLGYLITMKTTKTTRVAQLEEQVAQLEQRLAALKTNRNELEEQLIELRSANTTQTDAFLAFVSAMPRKVVFRALARHLHPDAGGDTAEMQELNAAWAASG